MVSLWLKRSHAAKIKFFGSLNFLQKIKGNLFEDRKSFFTLSQLFGHISFVSKQIYYFKLQAAYLYVEQTTNTNNDMI